MLTRVCSQGDRIGECGDGDVRFEHARWDNVDGLPKQLLKFDVEARQIDKIGPRLEVDEEVDVAGVIVFAAHYAAEDANVAGFVCMRESDDLSAMPSKSPAER